MKRKLVTLSGEVYLQQYPTIVKFWFNSGISDISLIRDHIANLMFLKLQGPSKTNAFVHMSTFRPCIMPLSGPVTCSSEEIIILFGDKQ